MRLYRCSGPSGRLGRTTETPLRFGARGCASCDLYRLLTDRESFKLNVCHSRHRCCLTAPPPSTGRGFGGQQASLSWRQHRPSRLLKLRRSPGRLHGINWHLLVCILRGAPCCGTKRPGPPCTVDDAVGCRRRTALVDMACCSAWPELGQLAAIISDVS